tara:strand:+ start:309 stop:503 length:195 start_codon:yes stop_codon:yes gene_type:complete
MTPMIEHVHNHPTMTSIGSEYVISDGNIYRKYRNGLDTYVFWKKLEENNEDVSDTYFNHYMEVN